MRSELLHNHNDRENAHLNSRNAYANVRGLDHADIIGAVTDCK